MNKERVQTKSQNPVMIYIRNNLGMLIGLIAICILISLLQPNFRTVKMCIRDRF